MKRIKYIDDKVVIFKDEKIEPLFELSPEQQDVYEGISTKMRSQNLGMFVANTP